MELRPERHVLDSDTISRILRKDNSVIRKFEAAFEVGSVLILCPMVYFEVRRGLYHRDSRALLEDFEQVARRMRWREFDRRMWETAAALWARMRRTGRPASDADVLIAAFAAVLGASVVTHNTRHTSRRLAFQRTTGASEVTE